MDLFFTDDIAMPALPFAASHKIRVAQPFRHGIQDFAKIPHKGVAFVIIGKPKRIIHGWRHVIFIVRKITPNLITFFFLVVLIIAVYKTQ
jgi:hypothetical protein